MIHTCPLGRLDSEFFSHPALSYKEVKVKREHKTLCKSDQQVSVFTFVFISLCSNLLTWKINSNTKIRLYREF